MEVEKVGSSVHTEIREALRSIAGGKVQDQQGVLAVQIREEEELNSKNRKRKTKRYNTFFI